jgi:hypothetical protein
LHDLLLWTQAKLKIGPHRGVEGHYLRQTSDFYNLFIIKASNHLVARVLHNDKAFSSNSVQILLVDIKQLLSLLEGLFSSQLLALLFFYLKLVLNTNPHLLWLRLREILNSSLLTLRRLGNLRILGQTFL